MSEATATTEAAEKLNEYKQLEPMSLEDFQTAERNVQLGVTDTLPDGRSIKEVQQSMAEMQLAQDAERREKSLGKVQKKNADVQNLEILVAENGSISARPPAAVETEEKAAAGGGDNDSEPDNDLPKDLPLRDKLIAGGIVSLEIVARMSHDDLIRIPGIKDASAEKILAYGKSV